MLLFLRNNFTKKLGADPRFILSSKTKKYIEIWNDPPQW